MPNVSSEQARPPRYLLRQRVIGIVGKAGVIDPCDARIVAQEFGDAARILDMALDAQRHRLDALQQQEGRQRRQHGAGGALIDAAAARDIGGRAEMLGVDQAVIGRVGLVEHREAPRVRLPGKAAGIDDGAAERGAVAAHEFGQRMHDDVGAVSIGRSRIGVATVLSTTSGTPCRCGDRRRAPRYRRCCRPDCRRSRRRPRAFSSSISFSIASALSDSANRTVMPWLGRTWREQRVGGAVELRHRDDIAAHARRG